MKPKLIKSIKVIFLLSFLLTEFFGFIVYSNKHAAAACTYNIYGPSSSATAMKKTDPLNMQASVTRSGSSGDCSSDVKLAFLLKTKLGYPTSAGGYSNIYFNQLTKNYEMEMAEIPVVFDAAGIANVSKNYTLTSSDWDKVANPNELELSARILIVTGFSTITSSQPYKIAVSGSSGGSNPSGTQNILVSFDKALYNNGDDVAVGIKLEQGWFIGSILIPDVEIVTTVNGKEVGKFNKTDSELEAAAGVTGQSTKATTENGFTNGSNTVIVKMFEQGSNRTRLYAQGTGQTQAQGLSSSSGGTQPEFIADKTSIALGDTINLVFKNPPSGSWSATLHVNGQPAGEMASSPFAITATADKGFKNGQNTITVSATDSTGKPIALKNEGNVTVSIGSGGGGGGGGGGGNQNSPCPNPGNPDCALYNPLPEEELTHAFLVIIQGFLAIVGIWAVIFIIVGGFQMVMAAGNEEAIGKAKKTITWAILGLVIALLSFSIVAIVQNLLKASVKPTSSSSYLISPIKHL